MNIITTVRRSPILLLLLAMPIAIFAAYRDWDPVWLFSLSALGVIPLVGNVAEHRVAVTVAAENIMDLSVEIAVASSLQIALFVAPVLVFISLFLGNPLQLIFNRFELLALVAGALITALVSEDGESNWLEGAELLAIYLILGIAFFLHPG